MKKSLRIQQWLNDITLENLKCSVQIYYDKVLWIFAEKAIISYVYICGQLSTELKYLGIRVSEK